MANFFRNWFLEVVRAYQDLEELFRAGNTAVHPDSGQAGTSGLLCLVSYPCGQSEPPDPPLSTGVLWPDS